MPESIPGTTVQPRLDHAGLAVRDLERAAAWYCAAFGYTRELDLRVEAIDLDIVMLIHPEHADRLELLHRPGGSAGPRHENPAQAAASWGLGHLAFDVAGLDAAYRHVLDLGARPVMEPSPSPEPGVRMAYVADPEGNLVELLDRAGRDA
ncbi:MAG: VOC family protein [Marmoricola sp.]|nr:VOC family protein [Marmoricola sp.]